MNGNTANETPAPNINNTATTEITDSTLNIEGNVYFGHITEEEAKEVLDRRIDTLCQTLKVDLETEVLWVCNKVDPLIENVRTVPLEIFEERKEKGKLKTEQLKTSKQRHRRDVADFVHKKERGNVSSEQLFVRAKECTENSTKQGNLRYSNLVFITGPAGSGKSTYAKMLAREMLDTKKDKFDADYVFLLRFKEVGDFNESIDFLDFLTKSTPRIIETIDEDDRKEILKRLEESDKIYFILDGLDEVILEEKDNKPVSKLENASPKKFIWNLLTGEIFLKAKKVFLSRPQQVAKLETHYKPDVIFTIQGLSEESKEQLCKDICADDARRYEITIHMQKHPDLASFCSIPTTYIMFVSIFAEMEGTERENVDSLSAIYVNALLRWFLKGIENFQSKELSQMAYKRFIDNRYYFEKRHLNSAKLSISSVTAFLTTKTAFRLKDGSQVVSYFSHLTWHEFFAAVFLRLFISIEDFKVVLPELEGDRYEVVTRFLFGLCNDEILEQLLNKDAEGINSDSDQDECKELLKNFVITKVKELRKNPDPSYSDSFMPVIRWVYEMRDDDFAEEVARYCIDLVDISNTRIVPSDVPSLSYILNARKTELLLDVKSTYAGECPPRFFMELFYTVKDNPMIKMNQYEVPNVLFEKGEVGAIAECVSKIEELNLRNCVIPNPEIIHLARKVFMRGEPMRSLNLSWISLDEDIVKECSKSIHKIKRLDISWCDITAEGVRCLAKEIKELKIPMEMLDLSGNKFGDDGVFALEECLPKIKLLYLIECEISEAEQEKLKDRAQEVGSVVKFKY